MNDSRSGIQNDRPATILFRSTNEYDDIDRFLEQLIRHGPTWEPVVRVTTRSVIETSWLPTRPGDPEPMLRRRHIFAAASYVRAHGCVYDPVVTFEFVNRLPEIVSLELYCGLGGDEGDGESRANEVRQRVRATAERIGLTVRPGVSEQELLYEVNEQSLRYLADLRDELRSSPRPFWSSVRHHIQQGGVEPELATVVDWSPTYWFVITHDFRVFRTAYRDIPWVDADLDRECEPFETWADFSNIYSDTIHRHNIEAAFVLVAPRVIDTVRASSPESFADPVTVFPNWPTPWRRRTLTSIRQFVQELALHGPDHERVVRLTRRIGVEWTVTPNGDHLIFDPRRRHIAVSASFVRERQGIGVFRQSRDDLEPIPNVIELVVYCGLDTPNTDAEAQATHAEDRIRQIASVMGIWVEDGVYETHHPHLRHLGPARQRDSELEGFLRSGDDPFWVGLRQHLHERDIGVEGSMIAWMTWEGSSYFFILVTSDRRVFNFDYRPTGAEVDWRHGHFADRAIVDWIDMTEVWEGTGYYLDIRAIMKRLDQQLPNL